MTKNIAETEINKKIKTIGKILEEIFGFINTFAKKPQKNSIKKLN